MHKSLQYLAKKSIMNSLKKLVKQPLKGIGILLITLYYFYLPFLMKDLVVDLGLNNRAGFVLIASIGTLYLSMPMTLSYFKRKGVNFKRQDINFILANPIPPKQALIYALSKGTFISLAMQVVFFIAAVFVFEIPVLTSLIYIVINLFFSNALNYSLAIIMYASENITLKQKQRIKKSVYLILFTFTMFLLTVVISQTLKFGFDFAYLTQFISSPVVLIIPIFGWQLGWLNLILLGVTPIRLLTTALFFITAIYLTYYAYNMISTGEYYEDALSFSEQIAILEGKKGNITLTEAFGNKQKKYAYKGELKGSKAKVIFYKQLIERKRVKKFFVSWGDLVYLIAGIGLGIVSIVVDDVINPDYFFELMVGISIYLAIFFRPAADWKSEFKNYYIFVMPDSSKNKLLNATLLEHFLSFIRAIFLTVPAGVLMRASFIDMFYAVIVQVLLRAMTTYVSIFIEEIIGAKIGKNIAAVLNVFMTVLIMIGPIVALFLITEISIFLSFLTISLYALILGLLFLIIASSSLENIESLEE